MYKFQINRVVFAKVTKNVFFTRKKDDFDGRVPQNRCQTLAFYFFFDFDEPEDRSNCVEQLLIDNSLIHHRLWRKSVIRSISALYRADAAAQ